MPKSGLQFAPRSTFLCPASPRVCSRNRAGWEVWAGRSPGPTQDPLWPNQGHGTKKGLPAVTAKCSRLAKRQRAVGGPGGRDSSTEGKLRQAPHRLFLKSSALPEAEGPLQPGKQQVSCLCMNRQCKGLSRPVDIVLSAFFE